ncbi:hypothetical protein [Streptosporangium saharense]|uniref:hypothetical protein n=1 Tax=Streptosporangium saharense TaxID=1706840 RepID=UPI0034400C2E
MGSTGDADEIGTALGRLARVAPGASAGDPSGAGARALLASITTEPRVPVVTRRYGPRRLVPGLAVAALLAVGIVVGPGLLGGGHGVALSYASSEIDVRKEGDAYVARVKDPFADRAAYRRAFQAVGLDVELLVVPVSPSQVGALIESGSKGGGPGTALSAGIEGPQGCTVPQRGCYLLVRLPANVGGKTWFTVGRPARPGEDYAGHNSATLPGEALAGVRVSGRTVGQVMAEVRGRGLGAEFTLVVPAQDGGHTESPLEAGQAGDDWTVWEAEGVRAGTVRLLVTRERLGRDPLQ